MDHRNYQASRTARCFAFLFALWVVSFFWPDTGRAPEATDDPVARAPLAVAPVKVSGTVSALLR